MPCSPEVDFRNVVGFKMGDIQSVEIRPAKGAVGRSLSFCPVWIIKKHGQVAIRITHH